MFTIYSIIRDLTEQTKIKQMYLPCLISFKSAKANLQRGHHFLVQLCRTIKKMAEEAACQPLLKTGKAGSANKK